MDLESQLTQEDDDVAGDGAGWMATFADMMTLLLTFFVLLLSFATMDITKFRMLLGSVKDAMGVRYEHPGDVEAVATTPVQLSEREGSMKFSLFDELVMVREIRKTIAERNLEAVVEAELSGEGVIVRVTGQVLYDLGDAQLKPEGKTVLDHIGAVARRFDARLMIEGHTDDLPISTERYPSNWELSTARAISAMHYLVGGGLPVERIGVAGYADARPLAPNTSDRNRAKNRRVEFVFIRMDAAGAPGARAAVEPAEPAAPVSAPEARPAPLGPAEN